MDKLMSPKESIPIFFYLMFFVVVFYAYGKLVKSDKENHIYSCSREKNGCTEGKYKLITNDNEDSI